MRHYLIIMYLLIGLGPVAAKTPLSVLPMVDSVLHGLSDQQRLAQILWAYQESVPLTSNLPPNELGGIYLTKPSEQVKSLDLDLVVALQLDVDLSPGINDLPSVSTLAAIQDDALLKEYFTLLRNECLELGYDFVVLPPDVGIPVSARQLIDKLHLFDSTYFLAPQLLGFDPPTNKKRFVEQAMSGNVLVIDPRRSQEYTKGIKKSAHRVSEVDQLVRMLIYAKYFRTGQVITPLKRSNLLMRIYRSAIIPFQKNPSTLPLSTPLIGLWSPDSTGSLMTDFSFYANRVYDAMEEVVPFGTPVVIDARTDVIEARQFAYSIQQTNPIIWVCTPENVVNVNADAFLVAPELNDYLSGALPQLLFGSSDINGKSIFPLPAFISQYVQESVQSRGILGFAKPQLSGMKVNYLDSIRLLAYEMIQKTASPGCQVVVAKGGNIVFQEAYGHLTYDSLMPTANSTIYDIASVTKVTSTLLAIMDLHQSGLIDLDSAVSNYLPSYDSTNKSHITIRQLLAHNAGLRSYIPFWKRSLKGDFLESFYYHSKEDEAGDVRSYGLKPDPALKDTLNNWIRKSSLIKFKDKVHYVYSDLGFMLLHQIVEQITGESIDQYVQRRFYDNLKLERTVFNPLEKGFERYEIAPTEYDDFYRKEQVWGEVHDRNAVVFGGVAGHAGLFSTAKELTVLMQMILQDGYYDGEHYLNPGTISVFNKQYFENNRRGLGWDKPYSTDKVVSPSSFGHLGFTGTMVWADPVHDLVFVFLSNRIFPNADNSRLNDLNIRSRMLNLVYSSVIED
ncbi:MAG: serine hydrolase [Cyclobacteriaceae bacterium]|nr:serine hydrolase [Cyclobacteriaceae bacterium HetDA_MAG_MS6]